MFLEKALCGGERFSCLKIMFRYSEIGSAAAAPKKLTKDFSAGLTAAAATLIETIKERCRAVTAACSAARPEGDAEA